MPSPFNILPVVSTLMGVGSAAAGFPGGGFSSLFSGSSTGGSGGVAPMNQTQDQSATQFQSNNQQVNIGGTQGGVPASPMDAFGVSGVNSMWPSLTGGSSPVVVGGSNMLIYAAIGVAVLLILKNR